MFAFPKARFRAAVTVFASLSLLAWSLSGAQVSPKALPLKTVLSLGKDVFCYVPEGLGNGTTPSFALLREPDPSRHAKSRRGTFVPEFSIDAADHVAAVFNLPPGIDLYGTGEVVGPLLRNGQKIELWNTDNYTYGKADGRRLYQAHPWVLALRPDGSAVGLLFDSTWRATLETTDNRVVFASQGPAFRVVVIEKDSPQEVIGTLADLTGHMPLPPRWSLGFQQCKFSYYPDARVREVADKFRARNLPCDVIWIDIDYMREFRVFTFDADQFPDPAATNRYLHANAFKAIWMIDPGVKLDPGYAVYDTGTKADVWVNMPDGEPFVGSVWPGPCVFPDFTMPRTQAWWADLYTDFMATGIDGVWNDMNEPSVFDGPDGTMNPEAWHRGSDVLPAGPHLRYHNVYGMLMVRASHAGIIAANPRKRPFILTRSNYLGGQRYAATWTGDNTATWEHLKMSVPMSITLGLSGQPFCGPDIGGFTKQGDPVLFAHWMALGAFYPFSRAHADNVSVGNEPWQYGPTAERVAQTALFRRYRLLPYLYTQMEAASREGLPLMRPVFFTNPADPELRAEDEAFLCGPDLLVVPKWAYRPRLPSGNWREVSLLADGREKDGYQPVVKIRPGAIVPLGRVVQNTTEDSLSPLTLLVNLDADGRAEGTLYEDSGDGFNFEAGDFTRSHFVAAWDGRRVKIVRSAIEGDGILRSEPAAVHLVTPSGVYRGWGNPDSGVVIELPAGALDMKTSVLDSDPTAPSVDSPKTGPDLPALLLDTDKS